MNKRDLIKAAIFEDLPYRKKLGIKEPFGLEIEMGLMNPQDRFYIFIEDLKKKKYKGERDNSIERYSPLEIATPVLEDNEFTWDELEKLSDRMKTCELDFRESSVQVNLDLHLKEEEQYLMLLFFRTYEHIIYRFSMCFADSLRDLRYARSLRYFFNKYTCLPENHYSLKHLMRSKDFALALKNNIINSKELPATIVELRTPNGCDDAWIWQNCVCFFSNFLKAIPRLDLEYIDYALAKSSDEKEYFPLDIEGAINFANIIFKKDIDKLYFLKQFIANDLVEVIEEYKLRK